MKKEIKNKILQELIDRTPNPVPDKILYILLEEFDRTKIEKALENLLEENSIEKNCAGNICSYKYKNNEGLPRKEKIEIGNTEIPRILVDDQVSPEMINFAIERLSLYANSLEDTFKDEVEKRMRSYWANIIILFGLFISLFSFILTFANKLVFYPHWSLQEVFLNNFVMIMPLLIIIVVFILLLKWLFN